MMKRFLYTACATLALSSCTSFNLVEQFDAPDKKVPVVIPETEKRTYYELNKVRYLALRVIYAKERTPLFTARMDDFAAPYCQAYKTYTPLPEEQEQLWLFPLTRKEEQAIFGEALSNTPLTPEQLRPIAAVDFDFQNAKKTESDNPKLKRLIPATYMPQSTGGDALTSGTQQHLRMYPTTCLPVIDGKRSWASKTALAPLYVVDTAGNVILCCVEGTALAAGSTLALPFVLWWVARD